MDEEERRQRRREATRRYRERLQQEPVKYAAVIARTRERQRAYRQANRERSLRRERAYIDRNRARIYARNREYARKNRDKIRKQQHEAYIRNLEANRAKDRDRKRKSYAENPKAFNDYMKKWRAANLERARAYVRLSTHRRRASAGGDFIRVEDWLALLAKYQERCGYCGTKDAKIEADHRIPLSRGGKNTIANIMPACLRCNRRKRTKTEEEFRAWLAKLAMESPTVKGTAKERRRGGLAEAAGPYRTAA